MTKNCDEHLCVKGISVEQVSTLESVSVCLSHRQAVLLTWFALFIIIIIFIISSMFSVMIIIITSKDLLLIDFIDAASCEVSLPGFYHHHHHHHHYDHYHDHQNLGMTL